jgi:hypothetical protein
MTPLAYSAPLDRDHHETLIERARAQARPNFAPVGHLGFVGMCFAFRWFWRLP